VSTNLELGGTLIMGTVNVEAQHSLEAVTATGNTTPLTIEFTNPTTSLVASGNVEVGGNVVAGYLYGDGSNISGISSTLQAITDSGPGANVTSNTVQFSNAITGFVTTANVEVGGDLNVSGNVEVGGDLDISGNLGSSLVNLVYPIGAIYISVNSADPGTIWVGTTWVTFGAGKTLVGIDSGDTSFDAVEETGGAKTHVLERWEIPPHQHNIQEFPGYSENASQWLSFTTGQYNGLPFRRGGADANYRKASGDGTDISNPIGNGSGAAASHNIMQPYIVTYMWKRTA
jgi:microcystin-dependent protein